MYSALQDWNTCSSIFIFQSRCLRPISCFDQVLCAKSNQQYTLGDLVLLKPSS